MPDLFRWIKVGPGIVGRNVPVAVAVFAVFGLAIWRLDSDFLVMAALAVVALLACAYFAAMFWYANKHPEFSTLDGTTLVDYRRAQMTASEPRIIDVTDTRITANTPPQIESTE
jgi:hypothetical protein